MNGIDRNNLTINIPKEIPNNLDIVYAINVFQHLSYIDIFLLIFEEDLVF